VQTPNASPQRRADAASRPQELIDRDRQVAHALAGGVMDRVGDRGSAD